MITELDDDDTTPTGNDDVMAEVGAAVRGITLSAVEWAAASSPGLRRGVNEDAWGQDVGTFVVADGMGGQLGGATAATTTVERFLRHLATGEGQPDWPTIVHAVNRDVRQTGRDQGLPRLGTTLVAAVVTGPVVTIIHLGDSRAYRWSAPSSGPARLEALTRDHTIRAELLAAGLDVGAYRARGVALHGLTSFIGLEPDSLRVDVLAVPVRARDRILLCTDGIHRQLDDDVMRRLLGAGSCRRAAEQLVAAADRAGGRDNATAVVVQIGPTPGPPT